MRNLVSVLLFSSLLLLWLVGSMGCSAEAGDTRSADVFAPAPGVADGDPGAFGGSGESGAFGGTGSDPAGTPPASTPPASNPPANDPPANDPPANDRPANDTPGTETPPDTCTPNCAGKQCGPDGCGGECGACGDTAYCISGVCKEEDTLEPAPETGACKNDADLQIMAGGGVSDTVESCTKANVAAVIANDPKPIRQCVKDATGLSDPCLDCFEPLMFCTIEKCAFQCIGGKTPECVQCLSDNCYPPFIECAGVNPANE